MLVKFKNDVASLPLWLITLSLSVEFLISAVLFSVLGFCSPVLTLNENQVLYLFSTSSQVLAAIYGLTLTGLVFFINELNREQAEDETREASTRELKSRYYLFLLFITVFVGLTFLLGNFALSTESVGPGRLNSFVINFGQSAFAFSLLAIAIFIFEVIDPRALERASDRLKGNLDPAIFGEEKGSLEEFIRNFNIIEAILQKYGEAYQYGAEALISQVLTVESQPRPRKRLANSRLAEILYRNEKISKDLFLKIRELIAIRNSIVHGADPVVSQHIVRESMDVLQLLKGALGVG